MGDVSVSGNQAVIVSAARTPMGSFNGVFNVGPPVRTTHQVQILGVYGED